MIKILISIGTLFSICAFTPTAKGNDKFTGVSSCSSPQCHGAKKKKKNSPVFRNEFSLWANHDAHSRAYKTLKNDHSKAIAKALGIDKPHEAMECLSCHSTWAPINLRGAKYEVEDGVGCESCHGAAERYLGPHIEKGLSISEKLKLGLSALHDPHQRSQICLNCHFGSEQSEVTHKLYGAGHPRLSFETDTYSALMPAHHKVDDDYVKRKGAYLASEYWLAGQIERARRMLKHYEKFASTSDEYSLYYCSSCHHGLEADAWKDRDLAFAPGSARIDLSSLWVAALGLKTLERSQGEKILNAINEYRKTKNLKVLFLVRHDLESAQKETMSFTKDSIKNAAENLLAHALKKREPYEVSEQVAMGLSALLFDMNKNPTEVMREVFRTLESHALYRAENFQAALRRLKF